jgi:hypothetical protein
MYAFPVQQSIFAVLWPCEPSCRDRDRSTNCVAARIRLMAVPRKTLHPEALGRLPNERLPSIAVAVKAAIGSARAANCAPYMIRPLRVARRTCSAGDSSTVWVSSRASEVRCFAARSRR